MTSTNKTLSGACMADGEPLFCGSRHGTVPKISTPSSGLVNGTFAHFEFQDQNVPRRWNVIQRLDINLSIMCLYR